MLACLQTGLNEVRVDWVEPSELEFGQVRVKVIAAGICGAQLAELAGTKASGPFPHIMGHEGAGVVQEIGKGVSTAKEGDKVVLHWRKGDGMESDFPRYAYQGYEITSGKVTTWAEEVVVSENRCTAVSPDAPDELCVLLGCGLSTALGTLEQEANLKIGESILIIGCGGLGLNLIRAAKIRGASSIFVWDKFPLKSLIATHTGATHFTSELPDYTMLSDVVIDTTGDLECIWAGSALMKPSGRFIMVGQPKKEFKVPTNMFEGEGKTIKATQGGGFRPHLDVPRYVEAWRAGVISLDGIITHRISLSEIERGIELVRQGEAGRILITM